MEKIKIILLGLLLIAGFSTIIGLVSALFHSHMNNKACDTTQTAKMNFYSNNLFSNKNITNTLCPSFVNEKDAFVFENLINETTPEKKDDYITDSINNYIEVWYPNLINKDEMNTINGKLKDLVQKYPKTSKESDTEYKIRVYSMLQCFYKDKVRVCSKDKVYNDINNSKRVFYIAKAYNVHLKSVLLIKTNEKGMFSSSEVYIKNMKDESEEKN